MRGFSASGQSPLFVPRVALAADSYYDSFSLHSCLCAAHHPRGPGIAALRYPLCDAPTRQIAPCRHSPCTNFVVKRAYVRYGSGECIATAGYALGSASGLACPNLQSPLPNTTPTCFASKLVQKQSTNVLVL